MCVLSAREAAASSVTVPECPCCWASPDLVAKHVHRDWRKLKCQGAAEAYLWCFWRQLSPRPPLMAPTCPLTLSVLSLQNGAGVALGCSRCSQGKKQRESPWGIPQAGHVLVQAVPSPARVCESLEAACLPPWFAERLMLTFTFSTWVTLSAINASAI